MQQLNIEQCNNAVYLYIPPAYRGGNGSTATDTVLVPVLHNQPKPTKYAPTNKRGCRTSLSLAKRGMIYQKIFRRGALIVCKIFLCVFPIG
jgi:hypothetical protein